MLSLSCFATFHSFSQISNPNSPAFKPEVFRKKEIIREQNQNVIAPTMPLQTNKGMTAETVQRQVTENAMRQMGYNPPNKATQNQVNQQNELNKVLDEIKKDSQQQAVIIQNQQQQKTSAAYKAVFDEILKMHAGEIPFSLKRAVFMVENVYCDYALDYAEFNRMINAQVEALNYLMVKEKISPDNQLGKNYLIQKLFAEEISYKNSQGELKKAGGYGYDFEDFTGVADWKKMFVWKLLKTGHGQCHSLPLLYLILAEETKTKAWLTLAPEHSFIQFRDEKQNTWYNFETTNGNVVSTNWIIESGYITSEAIKNKIYLDTLSRAGIVSALLADLTMGYIQKNGFDELTFSVIDRLEKICPSNIQAHLLKADAITYSTQRIAAKYKYPPKDKMQEYPELYNQFLKMNSQYDKIDNLGYIPMPEEMYQIWLKSFNKEKINANK